MTKRTDITGQQFGALTALEFITSKNNKTRWLFQCNCGSRIIKNKANVMRDKSSQSCGCLNLRKYYNIEAIAYYVFKNTYARKQNDTITFDEFLDLSKQNCHYCNAQPSNVRRGRYNNNLIFTYQGLDRLDSSKGHEISNVVPCCWFCNEKKSNTHVDDFIAWINKVHTNLNETNT